MLEACLDSIGRGGWQPLSVIVVDNGADASALDGLAASYPGVSVLRPAGGNAGYAGGCNAGLRRCASDYVVFLNDDALVAPGWLDPLVAAARRDPEVGALQPKILSMPARREGRREFDYAGAAGGLLDRLGYPFCFGRSFAGTEQDLGQYDEPAELFWASGVAFFAPRRLLGELGGFDESMFMHMEEIDLCWRMRLRGYRVRSVPGSVVWHEGGASLAQGDPEKVYFNHRNALAMLLRNRSTLALCWILPVRLALEALACLFYLAGGQSGWRRAIAVLRAAAYNLRHMGRTLRNRKVVQGTRRVRDAELFRGAPFSVFLMPRSRYRGTSAR